MTDKPQEPQTDWEGEGGAVQPEPKEKTPKGLEIPVRKRSEIIEAFKKIVRPNKP